ncbi:MAG: energy transducer TonB [Rhodoferax sp.]
MSSLSMNYSYDQRDPSRRIKGIVIVVLVHALIGYALVSGMARQGLNFIKKPLEVVVIQEVIIPPPPPPPPPPKVIKSPEMNAPKVNAPPPFVPPPDTPTTVSTAPNIVATTQVPIAPVVIASPPPPPPVVAGPKRTSIGLACPTQVPPEMPRKALQDGTEGVVKAQIHIKGNTIVDVTILSGPRVFHAAVKAAMMQYTCVTDGGEVIATQEFNFRVE